MIELLTRLQEHVMKPVFEALLACTPQNEFIYKINNND